MSTNIEHIKTIRIGIKPNADKANYLECQLYYDRATTNYYFADHYARGYYATVRPVEVAEHYTRLLEGYRELVHPCSRKSKKQEAVARNKCIDVWKMLIEWTIDRNNYELLDNLDKLTL